MTPPWHPERLAARLPFLRRRTRLRAEVAGFLTARGYAEVETPVLQPCPGMEPNLDPFATRYAAKLGADARALFLQFSPEFAMKKLLAGGAGPIFQFARTFRNGEAGPNHQPEFTMLEWYRPGLDLAGLMDETEALIRTVCPEGLRRGDAALPSTTPAASILQCGVDGHRGVKNRGERQGQGPIRSQAMQADDRPIGQGHAQPTDQPERPNG